MSLDATIWAWKIELKERKGGCRKPLKRLVLLSLADRAGEDHVCYPSMKRLEVDTQIERKTVLKIIAELVEDGLIIDTGERKGVTKQVKVYRLNGIYGRETVPKTEQFKGENPPGTVPLMEQSQNWNSSVNGTPNSANNGMPNSAVNGTQNLPIESPNESINKNGWLCFNKLRLELDQADSSVVPKEIIEASWFEREKKTFELFNAGNNLCDDLMIYHFADWLLKNRHKYGNKSKSEQINSDPDFLVFSSPSQLYMFANKLAHHPEVMSKYSYAGESYENLAGRIAAKLSDPTERQNWKSYLADVGFKPKGKGVSI
ncbi:helix-turn-helix domain-containing protein [Acinetobacter bereziniae]|uniref:helix-turn-helix domain-containing protein n=1 Tax=Acinetobacter bereziniae TaxID=106648 RepID=UPI002813DD29|nr:helix-turn-helix domain-containing protein [Acinetobacter bereziniae]MDQ9819236.1 helix-turn-helix domain-containing protein [Acinetobacter bereziniae]